MEKYIVRQAAPDMLEAALNNKHPNAPGRYVLHSVVPVIMNGATAHFLLVYVRD